MVLVHLAVDESNHGRDPEVVVGVFSTKDRDVCIKEKSGRDKLNEKRVDEFLRDKSRYMVSVAYPLSIAKEGDLLPVVKAIPLMIREYLGNGHIPVSFNILIDGDVKNGSLDELKHDISQFENVDIDKISYFPKKDRSEGRYGYNDLLEMADWLARDVYQRYYRKNMLNGIELLAGSDVLRMGNGRAK